eukprot:3698709-Alexandrium_andersonii.AAC.1
MFPRVADLQGPSSGLVDFDRDDGHDSDDIAQRLFQKTLWIPGAMHLCNNATGDLSSHMVHFE